MNIKISTAQVPFVLSALLGGFICILADLLQKSEASAVLQLGQLLDGLFHIPSSTLVAIGLILILAAMLPMVFDPATKKGAFYLGTSILAIMMTITPYKEAPDFKTAPNSVEVNLSISTQDGKALSGAVVTLWDESGRKIIARSKSQVSQFRFYQDEGTYLLTVEMPGYETYRRSITVKEDSPTMSFSVTLQPSSVPLFLQRIIR